MFSLLYNGPLAIKEAKLKEVENLASKFVPSDHLWYYTDLKSNVTIYEKNNSNED